MKHFIALALLGSVLYAQKRPFMSQKHAIKLLSEAKDEKDMVSQAFSELTVDANSLIQARGPHVYLPVKKGQALYTLYLMKDIEDKGLVQEHLLPVKDLVFTITQPSTKANLGTLFAVIVEPSASAYDTLSVEILDNKIVAAEDFPDEGKNKTIITHIKADFSLKGETYTLHRDLAIKLIPSGSYKPRSITLNHNLHTNDIGKKIPIWVDIDRSHNILLNPKPTQNPYDSNQSLWQLELEETLDYTYFSLERSQEGIPTVLQKMITFIKSLTSQPDEDPPLLDFLFGSQAPINLPGDYTLRLLKKVDKQDLRIRLRASSLKHQLTKEVRFNILPPLPYIEKK